jgi:hypothetical protein
MTNIKEKAQAERIVFSLLYAQIKSWKLQNVPKKNYVRVIKQKRMRKHQSLSQYIRKRNLFVRRERAEKSDEDLD